MAGSRLYGLIRPVQTKTQSLNRLSRFPYLLTINGAALTGCAVFIDAERAIWLIGLMLFLPFLDRTAPFKTITNASVGAPSGAHFALKKQLQNLLPNPLQISLLFSALILLNLNSGYAEITITTLVFTALPEEWFFRAYFLTRLTTWFEHKKQLTGFLLNSTSISPALLANLFSSALFALLHTPTQGWFGLLTFFPSLIFGWAFQKTNSLLSVILIHTLANLIFYIYLLEFLSKLPYY